MLWRCSMQSNVIIVSYFNIWFRSDFNSQSVLNFTLKFTAFMHSPSPAIQLYNIIILKLISSPQLTTTFLITHITHSQYLRIKYVLIMKNLQLDCKNISILVLFLEHPSRLHPGIWSDFRKFVSFPGLAVAMWRQSLYSGVKFWSVTDHLARTAAEPGEI